MKKLLGWLVGLLSFFILFNNSVFACSDGCKSCHGELKYGEMQEICDEYYSESGDQGGETPKECPGGCCGIKLNTNFPIIGNCIKSEKATGAFPTMMGALAKIVVSLILVVCFILIIYAGILWSMDKPKEAKDWIKRVAITILLLGFSGVILRLVNPNFFG